MFHGLRVHGADSAEPGLEISPRMFATGEARQPGRGTGSVSEAEGQTQNCATRQRSVLGRFPGRSSLVLILVSALGVCLQASGALASDASARELLDLSLEQLANLQITSVSKKSERLADAPASIFVITAEDIRRSGATTLPEALRLAPNLEVARVDANQYAISARGFNSTTANKLQVLIDGRSVYTPLYSGVFWDVQDVMLEDVDRIEVISGPAATLWGSNAVNGVINVITRSAAETQGGLAAGEVGNHDNGLAVRYGGATDAGGHYRVYGKFSDFGNTTLADGTAVRDSWNKSQAGFRADWDSARESFTLQGEAYDGRLEQADPRMRTVSGLNLNAHWKRQFDDGSNLRLRGYYDRTERSYPGTFAESLDILNFELQHNLRRLGRHTLVWGASYRHANDHVDNTTALAFLPADQGLSWTSVFAQDVIALREDLHLTAGMRLERNDFTGTESMPSVRLAWKPTENRLLWGALSRAIRTPSRIDRDLFVPGQAPFLIAGGPDFRSEVSNVVEIGYRAQPNKVLSYSVTAFHNAHEHIRSIEPTPGGALVIGNGIEGTANGLELWASLQASRIWRLSGGLLELRQHLHLAPDSASTFGVAGEGNDPKHQWSVRSSVDFSGGREFNLTVRRVGALPDPVVPAYTAVDARYGWPVSSGVRAALIAQNLFDPTHPEFGAAATRSEIARSVFLRLSAQF